MNVVYPRVSRPFFLSAIAFAIMQISPTVWAQDEQTQTSDDATSSLPTVVVTASGTEIDIKEAPASISVITREDIERKPVTSIGELLSTIPGVTGGLSATGAQSKIRMRGLPEKYTLILIDGKRQGNSIGLNYRDDLGQQDLDWISPEMIERIEVVRGPMSSLYGSEAMGGVINIITRKTTSKWAGSITNNYSMPESSKRGDRFQMGFNLSGPLMQNLGIRVGGNFTRRSSDESRMGYSSATSGTRNQNINALVDWKITEHHSVSLEIANGIQRSLGSTEVRAWGLDKLVHSSYGASYRGSFGDMNAALNFYHNGYKDKSDAAASSSSKETVIDGHFDLPLSLMFDQIITTGFQWKREELRNSDTIGTIPLDYLGHEVTSDKLSVNTWALFAEDQIFLRDNLALTLGLRMDHHKRYGSNWSPRAYLVYHPIQTLTIRGGVSRGFRAPGLKENSPGAATRSGGNGCSGLVNNPNFLDDNGNMYVRGGCYMAGNPDLDPETSTSAEIGASYDNNGWGFGGTYFHTDFKNKIDYEPLGYYQGNWWTRQTNAHKARTRGLEMTAQMPLLRNVNWSINLTRMFESKNLDTGADLTSLPRLNVYSTVDWRINPQWDTQLSAHYIGKQIYAVPAGSRRGPTFAKAYTTFDWVGSYKPHDNLTIRAGILNIADKDARSDGNGYDNGGRTFFLGLTAKF